MSLRPTTKRRLALIFLVCAIVIGATVGAYLFRQRQIRDRYMADRAAGLAAYRAGDYQTALTDLAKYNQWQQRDPQTLFAFARARSRVELPNYAHLVQAIAYYRRGLELDPTNTKAKHELLAIYSKPYVGYNAEAISLSDDLLKTNPRDIAALKAKATALYRLRRLNKAMAVARKLTQIAPLDMEGQQLSYELMYQLNLPADKIMDRAEKAYKAHPHDSRFEMLLGYAYMLTGQFDQARTHLVAAAHAPQTDPVVVRELCGMLDAMRLYDQSNALLDRSAGTNADPQMRQMLIRRLWQTGSFDQVVDRLKDLSPGDGDTQLLAFKAMSLYQLNQRQAGNQIDAALGKRQNDDAAMAWAKAIGICFSQPPISEPDQAAGYRAALSRDPSNAVIRDMLGQAYAQMGESEQALQQWTVAADTVESWALPRTQIARLLAATGRAQMAVDQATKAYSRARNVGSAIGLAVAWAAEARQSNDPSIVNRVLDLTSQIQAKFPDEPQTLPIYVEMLSRGGQRNKAIQVIQHALNSTRIMSQDSLIRLAQVSRRNKLGLETPLLAKSRKLHGLTPELAMAIATDTPDQKTAAATLRHEVDRATSQHIKWQLVLAQYLQLINDPSAKQTWVALGNANPANLTVQATIADLPDTTSVWHDRAFINQTIQRLHQITGDQGQRWQLAKARWLLESPDRARDSAQAVVLLTQLVRTSPDLLSPRIYLAKALENLNENDQAIQQLKSAAQINPESADISMELVQLLQSQGQFDDAQSYLAQLTNDNALTPKQRLRLATLLARSGQNEQALNQLSHLSHASTGQLLRATLLRRQGNLDGAAKYYRAIIDDTSHDADALLESAKFFALRNDPATAQRALTAMEHCSISTPDRQLLIARFDEATGHADHALTLLRQTAAQYRTAAVLEALAGLQLRMLDYSGAITTATNALRSFSTDQALVALKSGALQLQDVKTQLKLQPLIDAVSRDPLNPAGQAVLSALQQQGANSQQQATALQVCAERHPRFMPAQKLAFESAMKLKQTDSAAKIAGRCVNTFPNSPDAQEMLVVVQAARQQWSDMLTAAQQWRQRSLADPLLPDLAIAEADMAMGEADNAAKQLEPYVTDARHDPAAHQNVITDYCRALVMDGKQKDAADILSPLLAKSLTWRQLWLKLAGEIPGAQEASQWLSGISGNIRADDWSEQQALADAWYRLGARYGYQPAFSQARKIASGVASSHPSAPVCLIIAASSAKLSDPDAAVSAYRKALSLDPNLPVAQNNLAYQLLLQGTDLNEARQLAEKAVAARNDDAACRDTLAKILERLGDHHDAAQQYAALVQLQPNDVPAHIAYARTLLAAGERTQATQVLLQAQALINATPTPDSSYQQQIQSLRQSLHK